MTSQTGVTWFYFMHYVQKLKDCTKAMGENRLKEDNSISSHRQFDAAGLFILFFVHYANARSYLHYGTKVSVTSFPEYRAWKKKSCEK